MGRLLLPTLLSAGDRLCLHDSPILLVVFEAPPRDLGKELLMDDDGREPVGIAVIGFDRNPRELGANALIANLSVWIASTLPLHFAFLALDLNAVLESLYTGHLSAARTTEEGAVAFDAVTDDPAAAVRALWCQGVDGALEGVEYVSLALHGDGERFVVIVAADFTFRHRPPTNCCAEVHSTANLMPSGPGFHRKTFLIFVSGSRAKRKVNHARSVTISS